MNSFMMSTTNLGLKILHTQSIQHSKLIEDKVNSKFLPNLTTHRSEELHFPKMKVKQYDVLIQTKFGKWPSVAFENMFAENVLRTNR